MLGVKVQAPPVIANDTPPRSSDGTSQNRWEESRTSKSKPGVQNSPGNVLIQNHEREKVAASVDASQLVDGGRAQEQAQWDALLEAERREATSRSKVDK